MEAGLLIRMLRESHKMSREAFAEKLSNSVSSISNKIVKKTLADKWSFYF